jgi:DNA polymerase-1
MKKTSKKQKKVLVLLDAHSILHRAFHALPSFTSPAGAPTGALYGFSAMLIKILRELKPDYVAACYDLPKPTFRHIAFKEYKAHRPKTDEGLVEQISRSRDILKAFSIPIYDKEGFEADDIIGTIPEKLSKEQKKGLKIIIASGDMDTTQLVSGNDVVVYTLRKGMQDTVVYNENAVRERFGFGPEHLADYKGLCGDPSDNIPGVPGIGQKTATELIKKFNSLENIYKKLKAKDGEKAFITAGFKQRIINLLKENEEEAIFSKTLAQIRRDAPIEFSFKGSEFHDFIENPEAKENIKKIFSELGFRSLIKRLDELNNSSEAAEKAARGIKDEQTELFEKIENFYKRKILSKEVYELEKALVPVVLKMQKVGILLDRAYLEKLSKRYHKKAEELERKIWETAGSEFNIDSPKQLSEVLFEKMQIKAKGVKKTATGALSTKASELEKLCKEHPIIEDILSYREIRKLVTTYVDVLPGLVGKDGRLHARFDQLGTATGRFSSSDPNLQNIPIKSELGRNIRKAFIAPESAKLVAFDYSQIELRVLAVLSNDENLKKVFASGGDIHAGVASRVFGVAENKVTREMRRSAKVINFGIVYGMGVSALQKQLGCSRAEAQDFYDSYFTSFPKVSGYLEGLKEKARQEGFTETLFGRRRYFPDINSRIPYIAKEAERAAANHPIQGTAADIIKLAMVGSDKALSKAGFAGKVKLVLQIHDELVYEAGVKFIDKAVDVIKKEMESVLKDKASVPLIVDVSVGSNWDSLEEHNL